jgi:hypothetical protein
VPTNRHTKTVGHRQAAPATAARELARARKRTASAAQRAAVTPSGYNFHTHIGRPVLDKDGNEIRIGRGKSTRVRVEYVPIFADPAATAAVMVRRAARQAVLDAKRAAKAPRIAATEARRVVARALASEARARKRHERDRWRRIARLAGASKGVPTRKRATA